MTDPKHAATLIFSTLLTNPTSRQLSAGWNLVGLAIPLKIGSMDADKALISVYATPSGLVGYTQVLSPVINPDSWIWTRGDADVPELVRWQGYWVYMENADALAGFSTTPVKG